MSVHKRKFKNIPPEMRDSFIMHHLPYESWMMGRSLAAARRGGLDQFEQNLRVEGLALHARNLIEFLKNGDDCGFDPIDFAPKFTVNKKFIRGTLVDKINTQISHLTAKRTEKSEEKFGPEDWTETADAIKGEFNRWIESLTSEWATKWQQRLPMDQVDEAVFDLTEHVNGPSSALTISGTTGTASVSGNFRIIDDRDGTS